MIIGVIGMGLIGGSLCRTFKKKTEHICLGFDIDKHTLTEAVAQEAIDGVLEDIGVCDITFVCLHPTKTIEYILENKDRFKPGSIVCDVCGIKKYITDNVDGKLGGAHFVGCHPMAGREFSGFDYSVDDLFENASFIITKTDKTDENSIDEIAALAGELGFGRVVVTTPEVHDSTIAYTSQLAHIVSSAYVKSPTLKNESGFSAGSFRDLTRVAYLNADMWTDIFMQNRQPLIYEIDTIIKNLTNYSQVLKNADRSGLHALLKEGSELKEWHNKSRLG